MSKRGLMRVAGIAFLMIAMMVLTGCYGGSTTPSVTPGATSNPNNVSIANFAFSPQTLRVAVGTTVTWKNNDSTQHTVTSNTALFDSGPISTGAAFSYTFTQVGTFNYHCAIHSTMVASVIVQ